MGFENPQRDARPPPGTRLADDIGRASVVVLATDNEPTRYAINEICVANKVPFVVGRVFTREIGGEVFAYRPEVGGCLACLETFLQRTTFREGIREIDLVSEEEREKVCGMEIAAIKDSPGLAVDIAFIAAFHARFVLDAAAETARETKIYGTDRQSRCCRRLRGISRTLLSLRTTCSDGVRAGFESRTLS